MSKRGGAALLLVAAFAAVALPGGAASAQEPAGVGDMAAADGVAGLDWLAGAWIHKGSGDRLEEWWSAPVGNSIVGHFRWIRGDELWITELLSITEEEGAVLFRLRHFSADMTPWEAEDDAFVYRLIDRAAGRAAFTAVDPRPERPARFIFEALPGDSLLVRLEGEEEGRPTAQEFRYGRGG